MVKPPEFTRNNDDQFRIQASFSGGRYHFSLSSAAVGLLRGLNYTPSDTVPWDMFNCLAIIDDVWLPNTNDDFIEDLSNPESPPLLDDSEAKELAEYVSDRKVTSSERERLEELLKYSLLGRHLDLDSMNSTAEWVEETIDLVTDNSPTAVDDSE